jgi:hypothetical protein
MDELNIPGFEDPANGTDFKRDFRPAFDLPPGGGGKDNPRHTCLFEILGQSSGAGHANHGGKLSAIFETFGESKEALSRPQHPDAGGQMKSGNRYRAHNDEGKR